MSHTTSRRLVATVSALLLAASALALAQAESGSLTAGPATCCSKG